MWAEKWEMGVLGVFPFFALFCMLFCLQNILLPYLTCTSVHAGQLHLQQCHGNVAAARSCQSRALVLYIPKKVRTYIPEGINLGTVIIGDSVSITNDPLNPPMTSSGLSQFLYKTQNDH